VQTDCWLSSVRQAQAESQQASLDNISALMKLGQRENPEQSEEGKKKHPEVKPKTGGRRERDLTCFVCSHKGWWLVT
jgi:hypothetical protein